VGGNVEQTLIGFSVLNGGRSIPLHRKHHRTDVFGELSIRILL
jgi:hypothetical protein